MTATPVGSAHAAADRRARPARPRRAGRRAAVRAGRHGRRRPPRQRPARRARHRRHGDDDGGLDRHAARVRHDRPRRPAVRRGGPRRRRRRRGCRPPGWRSPPGWLIAVGMQVVAGPLARALAGGGSDVAGAAAQWLRIASLGAPGLLLAAAGNGWMRGVQDTRRPLAYVLGANLLSAALCPRAGLSGRAGPARLGDRQRRRADRRGRAVRPGAVRGAGAAAAPGRRSSRSSSSSAATCCVRGAAFQASFLSATAVAARFGTAAVAAHQIGAAAVVLHRAGARRGRDRGAVAGRRRAGRGRRGRGPAPRPAGSRVARPGLRRRLRGAGRRPAPASCRAGSATTRPYCDAGRRRLAVVRRAAAARRGGCSPSTGC